MNLCRKSTTSAGRPMLLHEFLSTISPRTSRTWRRMPWSYDNRVVKMRMNINSFTGYL